MTLTLFVVQPTNSSEPIVRAGKGTTKLEELGLTKQGQEVCVIQTNTTYESEGEQLVRAIEAVARAYKLDSVYYQKLIDEVTQMYPMAEDCVKKTPNYYNAPSIPLPYNDPMPVHESVVGTGAGGVPVEYQHDPDLWYALQASMGVETPQSPACIDDEKPHT